MNVFILTCCRRIDLLYGSTLVFDSIRTGFPEANVCVVDNASVTEARPVLEALADRADAEFYQLEDRSAVKHFQFIRHMIAKTQDGPVVFVDSDIVFWKEVERWRFDRLVAGRLIPRFRDEFTGTITLPRLHTSLLWISDVRELRARLAEVARARIDFDPWTPYMFRSGDEWYRLDAGASLYAALPEACRAFGAEELDAYDHLFCGSHIDLVIGSLSGADREQFVTAHEWAKKDPAKLRGIWREQESFFARRAAAPG